MTQSQRNRAESAVVDHLISEVITMLTDREGGRHAPPWEPKNEVRIGVLRPRINYPPPEDEAEGAASAEDIAAEEAASASELQAEPPSDQPVIGLDFTIRTNQPTAALEVSVQFALYHPTLPTRLETEARFKQLAADEEEISTLR